MPTPLEPMALRDRLNEALRGPRTLLFDALVSLIEAHGDADSAIILPDICTIVLRTDSSIFGVNQPYLAIKPPILGGGHLIYMTRTHLCINHSRTISLPLMQFLEPLLRQLPGLDSYYPRWNVYGNSLNAIEHYPVFDLRGMFVGWIASLSTDFLSFPERILSTAAIARFIWADDLAPPAPVIVQPIEYPDVQMHRGRTLVLRPSQSSAPLAFPLAADSSIFLLQTDESSIPDPQYTTRVIHEWHATPPLPSVNRNLASSFPSPSPLPSPEPAPTTSAT